MAQYNKEYYEAHKEELKAKKKAWYKAHKEEQKARCKAWRESHKEEVKEYQKAYHKAYYMTHKESRETRNDRCKAWRESHKEEVKEYYKSYNKAYRKEDINSLGQTKHSIRVKSNNYLNKYGKKIQGYEIHHCCSYTEPYKFIYCSKEIHQLIHNYLRQHNIDADSNHYEQIKHLLDDTVVLYGLE